MPRDGRNEVLDYAELARVGYVTNGLAAVANITAARKAMRKQTAPKGTILNLIPKYLIIPAALEGIAVQITNPINLAATASSADVPAFVRAMVPIVEPRLDAVASVGDTNWYTAADPSSIDTIEYCYLEGQQGEGNDLAFDIKAVASPNAASDLTVVIQT